MSCDLTCKRRFPCEGDTEKLKKLYIEKYQRHAARLQIKVLIKEESRVHDLYRDTRTKDRVYEDPVELPIFGPFDPFESEHLFWGIDRNRELVFTACTPILEELGIDPKRGDILIYQGREHEILGTKRKDDAYFDQYDYCFERLLRTYHPNEGS